MTILNFFLLKIKIRQKQEIDSSILWVESNPKMYKKCKVF